MTRFHTHGNAHPWRTAPRRNFSGGGEPTERHPSDWNWTDTALVVAIILTAAVCVWGAMQ